MVSLWSVSENVHGTLLCVVADNLAAHGLEVFTEVFFGPYASRFCYASKDEIQRREATTFELRTRECHDLSCTDIETGNVVEDYGVKTTCCFAQHLEYFHTTNGFPSDILHDFLEGMCYGGWTREDPNAGQRQAGCRNEEFITKWLTCR